MPRRTPAVFAAAAPLLAAALLASPTALQGQTPGPFTAAQAEAGAKVFAASCADCHLESLMGVDDAPPIIGSYFASSWGGHRVGELLEYVIGNMPFDEPGILSAEAYAQSVAYVLSKNGVLPGPTPLAKGVTGVITLPPREARSAAQEQPRITVAFEGTGMADVLAFFAASSRRSIVAGAGVDGFVTAQIQNQPWDHALDALLTAHGLMARELESGIILVEAAGAAVATPGRLVTRTFRLSFASAQEVEPVVRAMLTERGSASVVPSINALVVTDEERVLERVAAIL